MLHRLTPPSIRPASADFSRRNRSVAPTPKNCAKTTRTLRERRRRFDVIIAALSILSKHPALADNYDDYNRDELIRLLRERDRRPRFGLVWERDEIDHDRSVNADFVALELDADLSCGDGPFDNFIIEGDNLLDDIQREICRTGS